MPEFSADGRIDMWCAEPLLAISHFKAFLGKFQALMILILNNAGKFLLYLSEWCGNQPPLGPMEFCSLVGDDFGRDVRRRVAIHSELLELYDVYYA